MPLTHTTLGKALLRIQSYELDVSGAIYFQNAEQYKTDSPCIIAMPETTDGTEEDSLHKAATDQGYNNWLNIAVVSDTCDEVSSQAEADLVAAFNEDCLQGGWLRKMMNYRSTP